MKPIRHLRALQAFDVAATTSNLSKAAKVLGVTHGAVSRQIKQLEQYVGLPLFDRKPNGVEKTSAGNRRVYEDGNCNDNSLRFERRYGIQRLECRGHLYRIECEHDSVLGRTGDFCTVWGRHGRHRDAFSYRQ